MNPRIQPVIRRVTLRTREAARLVEFYGALLGLRPREEKESIGLFHPATGQVLLTLVEDTAAEPAPPEAPGLFHVAFRFEELADWRAAVRGALARPERYQGASDHGVSWAVYLDDPEGNGLELYWDKPASEWPWLGGQIQMVSRALPLRCILAQEEAARDLSGTYDIGHLHLQVDDLRAGEWYREKLGLHVTQADFPGALFLARGRYHHHLGLNTWRTGAHASRPENATGLVGWEIAGESVVAAETWREPTGAVVTLVPA